MSNQVNSLFRGTGAGRMADRLSLGQRTKEVFTEVPHTHKEVNVSSPTTGVTPIEKEVIVNVARSDPEDRKIIAECMAKIALLIMENNKIRYQIERTEHEISQKTRRA
jgi:hypothetical protein